MGFKSGGKVTIDYAWSSLEENPSLKSVGLPKWIGDHPGAILKEELEARGLSANAFALKLRVPPQRIQEIVDGKRGISPETALLIGKSLGTGARLWSTLQQSYDQHKAEMTFGAQIDIEVGAA